MSVTQKSHEWLMQKQDLLDAGIRSAGPSHPLINNTTNILCFQLLASYEIYHGEQTTDAHIASALQQYLIARKPVYSKYDIVPVYNEEGKVKILFTRELRPHTNSTIIKWNVCLMKQLDASEAE